MKIRLLLSALLLIIVTYHTKGQSNASIQLNPKSVLSIHGSTNLLTFTLKQSGEKIRKTPVMVTASMHENIIRPGSNNLQLRVKNFTSNNHIAQREFYKLMNADQYPFLNIRLEQLELNPNTSGTTNLSGMAATRITITNVTQNITIPINIARQGNTFAVTGKKQINIKDFNLEPPVAVLGLVTVSEWIEIDLDLSININ